MTLPLQPPLIVHHMGALDSGQRFPQNSFETVRASLEHGAAFVEVDITALSQDDYLLVHDPVLESETDGTGKVAETSPQDADALRYKGTSVRVPVLSEIVALFADYPDARLQLDFKNTTPLESDEPLQRLVQLVEPLGRRVIISSEADWQLRRLQKLSPALDLGFDIHFYMDWHDTSYTRKPDDVPQKLGAYGYYDDHPLASRRIWSIVEYLADRCQSMLGLVPDASTFYINHRFLVQSLDEGFNWAAALHEAGIRCDAWTMDIGVGNPAAEANAKRLLEAGVDQFTTNTPVALREFLGLP
ncbi:MAG: hypothetical protein H7175_19760 [Burkholderiales bacterium]|nr:hypothetical protein [Anaerolineae bacterium]